MNTILHLFQLKWLLCGLWADNEQQFGEPHGKVLEKLKGLNIHKHLSSNDFFLKKIIFFFSFSRRFSGLCGIF